MNNFLGIIGACLMGFTKFSSSYELLFIGRFIIGVNCGEFASFSHYLSHSLLMLNGPVHVSGLNTSLVPMYISEIAPLNLRGGLGTVNQLAVTLGLAISQILGIEQILGTDDGWPILLGLAVFPPVLQLLLLPFCPESPRYLLITKQWEEEARKGECGILSKPSVEMINLLRLPSFSRVLIIVWKSKKLGIFDKATINFSLKFHGGVTEKLLSWLHEHWIFWSVKGCGECHVQSQTSFSAPPRDLPLVASPRGFTKRYFLPFSLKKITSIKPSRGRYPGDEGRTADAASGGEDLHVRTDMFSDVEVSPHNWSCHATFAAVIWNKCCTYREKNRMGFKWRARKLSRRLLRNTNTNLGLKLNQNCLKFHKNSKKKSYTYFFGNIINIHTSNSST